MKLLLLLFLFHQSSGVIHYLNLSEYSKMPELYHMDDYDSCLAEPGGTYCLIEAGLYSKENSELMQMIREYSDHKIKHFNHTIAHRAFCVQKTCKQFIQNRSLDNEADLRSILEECVDDSLWKEYKLNARLSELLYCKKHGEKRSLDIGDFIVGAVYLILFVLNAVGTSYDVLKGDKAENPYLLAFSLRKNWRKLIAPSGVGPDPRLNRLKVINGLRTLTMVCVFFSHAALLYAASYVENPYYIETAYDDPGKYILFNGNLVTYTFFVMSGFLLAFNFELHAEKHRVSLWEWPKGMLMRYLRLTPTYALVMFTVMTLNRHLGDGPLWGLLVTDEADACNKYWWAHLLYINNYIYGDSHCFPQSWYLAADTQLFGLGLLMCILFRKPRAQMMALAALLAIALIIPAAHIYFQGLDAVVHQSPETLRTLFRSEDTYRIIFVAGHTNMSTYVLGIAGGLLAYHWMKKEKSISQRLQKFPWLMWLMFPLGLGTIMTGGFFYMDNFEPSTLVKIIYGTIHKPLFQLIVIFIIFACIFKIETVYRGILEWRGFTWTGRASYAGFLLHTMFGRGLMGTQRLPAYISDYSVVVFLAATIFLAFGAGALLWVTVESPLAVVMKTILTPPRRKQDPATEDADAKDKDLTTKV